MLTFGSLSEENRSNGIQPYGMKNLTGKHWHVGAANNAAIGGGVFSFPVKPGNLGVMAGTSLTTDFISFETKTQIKEYTDDIVVKNRKIRIYKRIA